jgi:hypothetical protein
MAKKQVHLTTEQLLEQSRRKANFENKMKFIKEKFYPALIKATTSIEDAIQNLTIINSVMMEKFLAKMKEVKMSDIDLYTNLSKDDPKYEDIKEMLNLFDEMDVFTAKEYFEGMKGEIGMFISDEQRVRSLDTLPTKWIDEK